MGVTQIQLSEEDERRLEELAAEEHVSVAAVLSGLVREGLRRRESTEAERDRILEEMRAARSLDREELKRRFFADAGSGHSGLHDVSERHDDYLEEIYLS